jgi:hypothetical protein
MSRTTDHVVGEEHGNVCTCTLASELEGVPCPSCQLAIDEFVHETTNPSVKGEES